MPRQPGKSPPQPEEAREDEPHDLVLIGGQFFRRKRSDTVAGETGTIIEMEDHTSYGHDAPEISGAPDGPR